MRESLLTIELAKRIGTIAQLCGDSIVLVQANNATRQALECEVMRLRSMNGELHGQIGMLAARVEELEETAKAATPRSESRSGTEEDTEGSEKTQET